MQYVEIAKLVLTILAFLVELIKDIKAKNEADPQANADESVDKGLSLLARIGEVAKVKELQGIDLKEFAPELKLLVSKIRELKS